MRTRWLTVAACAACAVCLGLASAPPAYAETAADGAPTDQARARFKEGVKFYDHGKYEQARVAFLQAYALTNHAGVLMNLAWSCLKAGHPAEAERYFHKFMSEAKDMTDKQIADATEGLNQAQGRIGHVDVSAPAGAVVLVDGAEAGTAPLAEPVSVDPGSHQVQIKGEASGAQSVSVTAGHTAHATLHGKAVAAEKAPAKSSPAAEEAPEPPPRASASSAASEKESAADEAAQGGSTSSEHHPGIFSPPRNMAPVVAFGSIAILGYAGAITGFVLKQRDESKRANDEAYINSHIPAGIGTFSCNNPPANDAIIADCKVINKENDTIARDTLIANISLGVGVAGTVATVIYWFAASKGPSSPSTGFVVTPLVGAGAGGLSVSGSF
jgi:PEGA domain